MVYVPVVEYVAAFVALYGTILYFLVLFGNRHELHREPAMLADDKLPRVSVVIPVLNEAGTISKTLNSVLGLDYPGEKLEVIVVDDGSTDGTVSEVKRFEARGVKLVMNQHRGIGKSSALNTGIKRASGEFIATLDSDSFPERTALRRLASFSTDKEVGAVTAAVKVHSPRNWLEKIQSVEYVFIIFSRRLLAFLNSVNVTPGPLSVFRKNVFDKVGLFDEDNILEDQEMAYRLQAANYQILSSMEAEVYTEVPATFKQLLRQRVRWNRGGLRNFYKHRNLFSTKYGDFGALVMPLALITVVLVLAIMASVAWQLLTGELFSWFSWEAFVYGFGPLHVISLLTLFLGTAWLLLGRKLLQTERRVLSLPRLLAFLVAYMYLMSVFWLVTLGEEFLGKKQKW